MNIEMISALVLFAFVSSITPGPNNLMLMASGANFGVRRSVQHILGVTLGFMLMIFLVGMGLAQIFAIYLQLDRPRPADPPVCCIAYEASLV
jgi:threonine/homoserine/homoserine lactone efflux protein